jgi:hypothetical protein
MLEIKATSLFYLLAAKVLQQIGVCLLLGNHLNAAALINVPFLLLFPSAMA